MGRAIGAMCLALAAWTVCARADEKNELDQLLAENRNLTVQLEKAKKTEGQIGRAKLALDGWSSALKHARDETSRQASGLVREQQDIHRQADATGCPWGTQQKDEAYVNSCNAQGRRLNEMMADVIRRGGSLQEVSRKLDEEQAKLSRETEKWFKQKKSNNTDLEILYQYQADWQRRYNAFVFHSDTYERLKRTAAGGTVCREAASVDDMAGAAQCLQRLWDMAR